MNKTLLALIIILFASCTIQKQYNDDWASDIDYLQKQLPKKHKNLFFKKSRGDFEKEIDSVKNQLSLFTDFEIAVKLQKLIAGFGDSHTNINWQKYIDKNKVLPLKTYWFKDGIYILKTTKKNKVLLGKKITSINEIDIKTIVKKISTIITVDNSATIRNSIPELLNSLQLLQFLNITSDNNPKIEFETTSGLKDTAEITIEPMTKQNTVTVIFKGIAFNYLHERNLFLEKYFDKEKIYYIQYNKCWSAELEQKYGNKSRVKNLPHFETFKNRILYILRNKPVEKLIFDMRFNSGGSSLQGKRLIEELAKIEKINQKGKLYVAIGRKTFSSAILNTIDFMELTNATLIGENTSGMPNHYGEVRHFNLPFSQLRVNYSTKYFNASENDIKTILPDIKIELSYSDFIKGIDPVFDWIKRN